MDANTASVSPTHYVMLFTVIMVFEYDSLPRSA